MKYSRKWSIFNNLELSSRHEKEKQILEDFYTNTSQYTLYKVSDTIISDAIKSYNDIVSLNVNNTIKYKILNETLNDADKVCYLFQDGGWLLGQFSFDRLGFISGKEYQIKHQKTLEGVAAILALQVFIKNSNIQTKIIKSRPKSKSFHCRHERQNDTGLDIHQCDLNWYTKSLQNHPFVVRGHWRMQACGQGMKDRKLKWIDTFMKGGYLKGAYKEKV